MKAIIIDDEEDGRNVLRYLLKKYHPEVVIIAEGANGMEGEKLIRLHKPDFIFLDVNMPLCDGFEMLGNFENITFEIVFTTAYNEYAIKAFKFSPFDFLLKPVNLEELNATLQRLKQRLKSPAGLLQQKDFLNMVKSNQMGIKKIAIASTEGFEIIDTTDIIMLEADGSYTRFFLKDQSELLSSTGIGEYEVMLSEQVFMRIHKSYIVNLNEIKKYIRGDGGSVILSNNKEAFVSKRKKDQLIAIFK
jgi:two-component system LytT family response regulator